jgi:hypothetical protein
MVMSIKRLNIYISILMKMKSYSSNNVFTVVNILLGRRFMVHIKPRQACSRFIKMNLRSLAAKKSSPFLLHHMIRPTDRRSSVVLIQLKYNRRFPKIERYQIVCFRS